MRRRIQIVGWTLIWSGVFVLGYVGWELFATDLINQRLQSAARADVVDTLERTRDELPPTEEFEGETPEPVEFHREDAPEIGQEFALLTIDRIGLEAVVFEGVDRETLKNGPGHMPTTAMPGQPGNAVISGHRTTYGRPFFDFDQLVPGDLIEMETAIGVSVYEVRSSQIVEPTDVWVTEDRSGSWLTLTTCNPKFSARQRLIVFAELVDGPNLEYVQLLEDRLATSAGG